MTPVLHLEPFPHILIHDMYDEVEMSKIWKEFDLFTVANNFLDPEKSDSAVNVDGKLMKNNLCIKVDQYYRDRLSSPLLTVNRKLWSPEIVDLSNKHWALNPHYRCNEDTTLVSYYENSHYYEPHFDCFNVTALTHFYKDPKCFSGGDLYFPEFDNYTLTTFNNRCIMFPSSIRHGVTEVEMNESNLGLGLGRWTVSQFMRFIGN